PAEDLAQYPRDLERDRQLAGERGVDCLFVPDTAAMYPAEPLVRVSPGPMADPLEGAARPGHFAGVLTVIAKLFHIVEPDIAVVGRSCGRRAWRPNTWPSWTNGCAPWPGSMPAPWSWWRRRSARRGSSTTWCSAKAWPPTRPCERDGAPSVGGGHPGAPRACRACRRAPRHLGRGDARARGRARALAQGG